MPEETSKAIRFSQAGDSKSFLSCCHACFTFCSAIAIKRMLSLFHADFNDYVQSCHLHERVNKLNTVSISGLNQEYLLILMILPIVAFLL
ncbi:hypothetical protein [Bartonella birtlesii]|uniref:Uncharacterized protein n=1 Tax=Bartonella birtlesii LL-WM9 TaxID=1094552 RepID=J1ISV3_9HYPH|nr:hypothetical protein [Bartonella birtlesii]EJF74170.1 hypothetical protein ME7_01588 [Bartonella birtlesii LL-WM9]